jgi:hypothetical protein
MLFMIVFWKENMSLQKTETYLNQTYLLLDFLYYIDRFFVSKFQRTNLTVVEINIFYSQTERKGQK